MGALPQIGDLPELEILENIGKKVKNEKRKREEQTRRKG